MSAPETLSDPAALAALPGLPRDAGGPVFAEPWQAQAFALAVQLSADGVFTWPQWAQTLAAELAADPGDDGSRYYEHWVAALERLATGRGLVATPELAQRKVDWAEAHRHTPHGKPVKLARAHDH
ncbi:MAG TPA: nitrile hydratase accessory protein [Caulobacteraceae bacterium]|nr:nitrile hydratase accessory protein [Caulobacteraceae bacterium]